MERTNIRFCRHRLSRSACRPTSLLHTDARSLDLSALNITPAQEQAPPDEPPPKMTIAREKVLEEARKALQGDGEKKGVSMVVIGECK